MEDVRHQLEPVDEPRAGAREVGGRVDGDDAADAEGLELVGVVVRLLGGALAGYAVTKLSERHSSPVLPVLACVAIGLVALAATYFEARMKVGL